MIRVEEPLCQRNTKQDEASKEKPEDPKCKEREREGEREREKMYKKLLPAVQVEFVGTAAAIFFLRAIVIAQ